MYTRFFDIVNYNDCTSTIIYIIRCDSCRVYHVTRALNIIAFVAIRTPKQYP